MIAESLRCVKEPLYSFSHNEYEQSSCLDDNLFSSVWLFYTFGNNDRADREAEAAREAHADRCRRTQWWSEWHAAKAWEEKAILTSAAAAGALEAHYRRTMQTPDDADIEGIG